MMKDILKGIVVGLANIIPGVSGGTMMVAMGIYDKLIHCITHLFKEFKKSFLFLLCLFSCFLS
jgi:putative membrane protein